MTEILQAVGIFSILVSALVGFFFWADPAEYQSAGRCGSAPQNRPAAGAGSERAGAVSA